MKRNTGSGFADSHAKWMKSWDAWATTEGAEKCSALWNLQD